MSVLYSAAQVRELDRIAIEEKGIPGLTLMKRAGEACVSALLECWRSPAQVAVLCGSGNNAGDGFIIAGLLRSKGIPVKVGLVGREPAEGTDAAGAFAFCRRNGVEIGDAQMALEGAEIIVDALLGTGISGSVREDYARVIQDVNERNQPVLAVDLPSGLCADTGATLGACIKADVTVTFVGRKLGLMTCDGPEQVGKLVFADLDVPGTIFDQVRGVAETLVYEELIDLLSPRHRNSHKVSHGHVLVIGGDKGMAGAAAMASEAALYCGAGMVTVATRPDNVAAIVARRPEVMPRGVRDEQELSALMARATVVVLGPGLGRSEWSQMMFNQAVSSEQPLVLDADGLNLLSEKPFVRDDWILTPHPGEAQRLLAEPGQDEKTRVQADRLSAVRELQQKFGGIALLKGAGTLIASGEGVSLCPYGNPGMSVAGMGDLLAGTIGGLLAQGLSGTEAVMLGAVVHSLAADRIVEHQGERGLLATELLPVIRNLVNKASSGLFEVAKASSDFSEVPRFS